MKSEMSNSMNRTTPTAFGHEIECRTQSRTSLNCVWPSCHVYYYFITKASCKYSCGCHVCYSYVQQNSGMMKSKDWCVFNCILLLIFCLDWSVTEVKVIYICSLSLSFSTNATRTFEWSSSMFFFLSNPGLKESPSAKTRSGALLLRS